MNKTVFWLLFFGGIFLPLNFVLAGTVLDDHKYAWSSRVGYISFEETIVNNEGLSGYAWSKNNGWINLSPEEGGVLNDGLGNLSGYAWGESLGWIDFENVSINISMGKFSGTATGDLVGVINFNCPNYCDVVTDWRVVLSACSDGVDNDSDGKVDYPTDPGCSSSSDGDESNSSGGGGGGGGGSNYFTTISNAVIPKPLAPYTRLDFTINNLSITTSSNILNISMNGDPNYVSTYLISLDKNFKGAVANKYTAKTVFNLPDKDGQYDIYLKYYSSTGTGSETIMRSIEYKKNGNVVLPVESKTNKIVSGSGSGSKCPSTLFSRDLKLSMVGEDVKTLQKFLNAQGFKLVASGPGSPGKETTKFGWATQSALTKFQKSKKIVANYGVFDLVTRTYLGCVISKSVATSTATTITKAKTVFTRYLKLGMVGDDVKALQQLLNNQGFKVSITGPGSPGKETTKFGWATQAALIRFQKKYNLNPPKGYVGPGTMEKLNSLQK
ncbi:MAG: peptidoglycan-binding domain-containing protein [Patescibacteria group bacterium]